MTALLESIAAVVTLAADGAEAVEAASRSEFDVILMDMRMPNMGGLEATRLIREDEAKRSARRTAILAVTASAEQHPGEDYQAAGLDGVFPKPIDARTLTAAISEAARAASPKP